MSKTLENLKAEMEQDSNLVVFALFYDRENKRFLAHHQGNEAVIENMVRHAACNNGFFASMFRKVSYLFSPRIPKPDTGAMDFFDILRGFKK